jgi:hypothetical protein
MQPAQRLHGGGERVFRRLEVGDVDRLETPAQGRGDLGAGRLRTVEYDDVGAARREQLGARPAHSGGPAEHHGLLALDLHRFPFACAQAGAADR